MINVLHVVDKLSVGNATIHGVTRLLSWWIPCFDKREYNIKVCCLRGRDKAAQYLEEKGIQVQCLHKHKFDLSALITLMRLVRKEKINILHLHGYGAWTFGRIVSLLTGVPAVLHEHFADPKIPFYQKFVDYAFRGLPYPVLAVSEYVKDFCVKSRGVMPEKVILLYNGAPLDEFSPILEEQKALLKKALAITEGYQVVGTIGRLDVEKGIEYFLRAIPAVHSQCPQTRFLIVGDGPLLGQLQAVARRLSLDNLVDFVGFRKDISEILAILDVMVIPSLREGAPLTAFEAMAMGKPIVATEVGGLKEILQHKKTALLIPSQDPSALAESVVQLLQDQEFARQLGNTACKTVKNYDIRKTVRGIEQIYKRLVLSS